MLKEGKEMGVFLKRGVVLPCTIATGPVSSGLCPWFLPLHTQKCPVSCHSLLIPPTTRTHCCLTWQQQTMSLLLASLMWPSATALEASLHLLSGLASVMMKLHDVHQDTDTSTQILGLPLVEHISCWQSSVDVIGLLFDLGVHSHRWYANYICISHTIHPSR